MRLESDDFEEAKMDTGGVSNKKYFDFNIEGDSFQSSSPGTKPSRHGCALETLKKIENILKNDLKYKRDTKKKEYLTKIELNELLQKSSEIRTGYKHKLGWFARTFFSKEKQVDKIYNTIQRLVEVKLARLEKIQTEKGSRDQLPIPKDLMKSVTSYLDIKSLASLQSVSSQTLRDIDSNMPEQAKEYGYTGPSINAKTWVKILNQVKELAQRQVIPDKYIIQKNGKINEIQGNL